MAERAVLRTRSVCVRRLESDGVINVRFSGNCLMNSDGGRGGERWDVDRSSAGISVPDFLYEYFMSQLDEFVWILFVCASLVFVLTWYVILVRSDVPKGRAVLSSAPGQRPCLGPLLHRDPTRRWCWEGNPSLAAAVTGRSFILITYRGLFGNGCAEAEGRRDGSRCRHRVPVIIKYGRWFSFLCR